jgi:hypothetical protein
MFGGGSTDLRRVMTEPARIVLALDAAARDPAALDTLAEIARELDADPTALIVQDVDLLRLARLPFARELGALTAAVRPLTAERVEATLRAQARRAERLLLDALKPHEQRLSLRFTQGKIVREAMAAAFDADFVLFSAARPPPRTDAPRRPVRRRSIVLILEDAPLPVRPLQVAAQLQRLLGATLSIVVAGTSEAVFSRVRSEVAERLPPGSGPALFRRVPVAERLVVARAAVAEHATLVVLSGDARLGREEDLTTMLHELGCALLWVRGGRPHPDGAAL